MSVLAVAVQFFAVPRIVRIVPPEAFVPRPAVHSAVLTLTVGAPPLPRERWRGFFALVQAGFGAKRKQIHNSLTDRLRLPRETVSAFLDAAGIDGMRRAQTLALDEWLALDRATLDSDISLISRDGAARRRRRQGTMPARDPWPCGVDRDGRRARAYPRACHAPRRSPGSPRPPN